MASSYKYETLRVSQPRPFVFNVELNRPQKLNAMNLAFWSEMKDCMQQLATDADCRVIVLSGAGRIFTSGLDLNMMTDAGFMSTFGSDVAHNAFRIGRKIINYQETFTAIEQCAKPVIAAIHNACVGGGIDMTTACDIRYCTQDAWFQVKEVDIGAAADAGTLQRLPRVVGSDSLARELCYTARRMNSAEALRCGLVSQVFSNRDAMLAGALDMAEVIAGKSPVAVQSTKVSLVYSRDHSVPESLQHIATWNQGVLKGQDMLTAAAANIQKTKPEFSKL